MITPPPFIWAGHHMAVSILDGGDLQETKGLLPTCLQEQSPTLLGTCMALSQGSETLITFHPPFLLGSPSAGDGGQVPE